MSKWKKEKALPGKMGGWTADMFKMNWKVCAGFGVASITKDGEDMYHEPHDIEWEDAPTMMKFENMARKDPDHDWRFNLLLPLREAEYQRHGKNQWVLIKTGEGFA